MNSKTQLYRIFIYHQSLYNNKIILDKNNLFEFELGLEIGD